MAPSYFNQMATAIVLGGGRGTRLWPLTKYRAKPAVPLAGKYRLIDIPISLCLNSGFNRIYVLTQFNSSSLNRHISETYQLGMFSQGGFVTLEAASQSQETETWYQGTADAVRRNLKNIQQWNTDHVIILPGDTIFRMDLSRMLQFHIDQGADITISLNSQPHHRASGFGIITLDDNDRIVHMTEKPKPEALEPLAASPEIRKKWNMPEERPFLASMGVYIFRTEVLAEILADESMIDFGQHILPRAVKDRNVAGYVFNGYWEDIGTIEAFFDANLALSKTSPPFKFYQPNFQIFTHLRWLPSSQCIETRMHHTRIAEGCEIRQAEFDTCLLGVRSIVGKNVRMREVVMMGADYYEHGKIFGGYEPVPDNAPLMGVGDNCEIERAIIDKNARIGADCKLLNREGVQNYDDPNERFYIRDGILIVPKHGIIEPGTEI